MQKNNVKNFTVRELALLKKVDAILALGQKHSGNLSRVPAFVDKLQTLGEKRSQTTTQSVVKLQATKSKVAMVKDANAEKKALVALVSDNLGHFKEYAKDEKDSNFKDGLTEMTKSALSKMKPMDLVTNLNVFVETVKGLKADRLAYHGLPADWVVNITGKVAHYNDMLPQKATMVSNKPAETTNFKEIMAEIKSLVDSLNNLVGPYETANLDFYKNYILAADIKKVKPKTGKKSTKAKQSTVKSLLPKVKKERKSRKKKTTDTTEVAESTPVADANEATSVPAAASDSSAASAK